MTERERNVLADIAHQLGRMEGKLDGVSARQETMDGRLRNVEQSVARADGQAEGAQQDKSNRWAAMAGWGAAIGAGAAIPAAIVYTLAVSHG